MQSVKTVFIADDDKNLGPERIAQPGDRLVDQVEPDERLVHHPVECEHRLEENGICDKRRDAGQEDRGSQQAAKFQIGIVQQSGHEQSQNDHDRHLHHQKGAGVQQGLQEDRILRQAQEVVEAAEGQIHPPAGLKAHPQGGQDRVDHEEPDHDHRGHDECPAVRFHRFHRMTSFDSAAAKAGQPPRPPPRLGITGWPGSGAARRFRARRQARHRRGSRLAHRRGRPLPPRR